MLMLMNGRTSKYPFTPTQWEELEHQALIYNYMVSGVPVPPDLIHPMRRNFLLESTPAPISPSLAFPLQSSDWGCFQLGFGRKAEDPEPGRCRRTDGKKWRCSKEAYRPDSKYCERHMHRGKNRSRKPVEMSLAAASSTPAALYSSSSSSSLYPPPPLSISTPEAYHHQLMYPYSTTSVARPQHIAPTYFQLDRESYSSSDKDNSAVKVDVDGYCFLSEASGGHEKESSLQLGTNSLERSVYYSHCTTDLSKEPHVEKQQHCFVLGADFKLEKPLKVVDAEQETQRPLRHFIDEWPQVHKSSWASMEGDTAYPKTQLSISTPMAHHNR